MIPATLIGGAFRRRFALRRFRDGGIVLDLATGTYIRMNQSAAEICSIFAESDNPSSIRTEIKSRVVSHPELIDSAIAAVAEGLSRLGPRRQQDWPFHYSPADSGYVLAINGVPAVRVAASGATVALLAQACSEAEIFQYMRALAPKLLFLQSTLVLHGASSRLPTGIRVISGESGAGKTTTARAFDAAGVDLFSEDMLVVASTAPLQVHIDGEQVINNWAAAAAQKLARTPSLEIAASELSQSTLGAPERVREIWFIDASRRAISEEPRIAPKRLGETDAALALMNSLFLGGTAQAAWRLFMSAAADIAREVPVYDVSMPAGIERLGQAARSYTENSAS